MLLAAALALHVALTPVKAGTEAAPRPTKVKLDVTAERDARRLTVFMPKQLRISNTGLAVCSAGDADLVAQGPQALCKDAIAGSGTLATEDAAYRVTPLVSADGLLFFVDGDQQNTVLHGTFSQAVGDYTAKLRVPLPEPLRGLRTLKLTLQRRTLFATRGCVPGGLPFKVQLGTAVARATATCRR